MPVRRPSQLPPRSNAVARITPVAVGDDWTAFPYSLWGATKITLNITGNAIEVQFSRDQPPNPPTWDDPIPIPVGFWSHVGPFGYVRFRNQRAGAIGTVYGALYAE